MTTSKPRVENTIPPGRYTIRPASITVHGGVMVATYETVDMPKPVTITETRVALTAAEVAAELAREEAAFMAWAASAKPCRYCRCTFVGPVCPCEETNG
jgi:hypothetical protein